LGQCPENGTRRKLAQARPRQATCDEHGCPTIKGGFHEAFSVKRMSSAAAVFTFGAFGSVGWSNNCGLSVGFIRGDFPVLISTANAAETSRVPRHTSCTLVRYYVASIPQLLPRRRHGARARRTQKFRPLRAVSRLDKLHSSATRWIAPFDPPRLRLRLNLQRTFDASGR